MQVSHLASPDSHVQYLSPRIAFTVRAKDLTQEGMTSLAVEVKSFETVGARP